MEEARVRKIAEELSLDALKDGYIKKFRIINDSMKISLYPEDLVSVARVSPGSIRPGDIILFRRKGNLILHRVIGRRSRGGTRIFRTKGDNAWRADGFIVRESDIIGKAVGVERRNRLVDMASFAGRMEMAVRYIVSNAISAARKAGLLSQADMRGIGIDGLPGNWLSYCAGIDPARRMRLNAELCEFLKKEIPDTGREAVDLGFGFGFSETAISLRREGFRVRNAVIDRTDPEPAAGETVLLADILGLFPRYPDRKRILDEVLRRAGQNGLIVLAGRRYEYLPFGTLAAGMHRMLRRIAGDRRGMETARYRIFTMKEIISEIGSSGFRMIKTIYDKGYFVMAVQRR
ncbi:MAG: signal peptidase I [Elusimicrobia bacterium]|nr:signal peptidase I [Elusimicrobiota bacterium]